MTILLDVLGAFAYTAPLVCPVLLTYATGKENQQ
jgi:hypothetical protein